MTATAQEAPETALATPKPKAISKAQEFKAYIDKNKGSIASVLPRVGLTPEALARTAISQVYKNPLLLECDKTSVMRAIVEAASLGLSFSLGRAYLVPFNNKVVINGHEKWRMEAQLIPGYQGLADVARRSGEISTINAQAVFEGDVFEYEFGLTTDKLVHKPMGETDPAKLTHAYAIVRFKDGGYQVRVMTRKQIEKVRSGSKSPNSLMWKSHFDEGAIKTVAKRVLKLCPASPELVRALELDNSADEGLRQSFDVMPSADEDFIDLLPEGEGAEPEHAEPTTKTSQVKDALQAAKKAGKRTEREEQYDRTLTALDFMFGETEAKADVAISEATGGKLQSKAALIGATLEQLKQVETHAKILADEGAKS